MARLDVRADVDTAKGGGGANEGGTLPSYHPPKEAEEQTREVRYLVITPPPAEGGGGANEGGALPSYHPPPAEGGGGANEGRALLNDLVTTTYHSVYLLPLRFVVLLLLYNLTTYLPRRRG